MANMTPISKVTLYKEAREESGLKQWQAARDIPTSKSSINRYELGKSEPPPDVVFRMDKVYGCGGRLVEKWMQRFKFSCSGFKSKKITALTAIKAAIGKVFNLARL